jgi:hypothetical protein
MLIPASRPLRRHAALLISLLIFVASAALYIATAPRGMIFDGGVSVDSPELQRVAYRLGIAHSTGYPVWTMMGFLAARLGEVFGDSPYSWVTYLSAVLSAGALVCFFNAALMLTTPPAALFVTGVVAFSNIFWHLSTIAEVQGLQALLTAALLWLLLIHLRQPKRFWPLGLGALLVGVGLANHRIIVLLLPSLELAVLLSGRWRRMPPLHIVREIALLALLMALPLLTYLYLYWRATDPYVVFSARRPGELAGITMQDVTDLIRGTFQGGGGLEANFALDWGTLGDRARVIWARMAGELGAGWTVAGIIGLAFIAHKNARAAVVLAVYLAASFVFLMAWQVDVKAQIYTYTLTFVVALGLTGWVFARGKVLAALLSLPLFWLALTLFLQNLPARDLSDDRRIVDYWRELDTLPSGTLIYSGYWTPETFHIIEYLHRTGRDDLFLVGIDVWWGPLDDIFSQTSTTYLGTSFRSRYGLYDGATWFQEENGVAFAGTGLNSFLQALPAEDTRLAEEANTATVVEAPMGDAVELYSVDLDRRADGFHLTLYWRASAPISDSLSVYTHLRTYGEVCNIDTVTALLAQDDSYAPVEGTMPTRLWRARQIVRDTYFIPWVGNLPENAALAVGMTFNGERVGEYCIVP